MTATANNRKGTRGGDPKREEKKIKGGSNVIRIPEAVLARSVEKPTLVCMICGKSIFHFYGLWEVNSVIVGTGSRACEQKQEVRRYGSD